ncbi:MAG TPA: SDR family oxidoreductase [Candidatus Binataceae bacterium]|nr:SDR family oxidoreductase [Candidatus Binataceae bacterium]
MPTVDFSLNNRVAIITGGSKGIGRAIALAFAEHGADIALAARGREALEKTRGEVEATGRRCLAIAADLSREEDWPRIVDETAQAFGGIDILVNNAAAADKYGPIAKTGSEGWDLVMRVNLKASFFLSKLCRPHMQKRGGGSVLHITSNEAVRPSYGLGAYSVSKGALVTLTQVCAKEWAAEQIRVNCIAPGLVRTELAAGLVQMVEKSGLYPNPMNRIGEPGEIAGLALYLVSPAGRYATGQTFVVDGGELVLAPTDPRPRRVD